MLDSSDIENRILRIDTQFNPVIVHDNAREGGCYLAMFYRQFTRNGKERVHSI